MNRKGQKQPLLNQQREASNGKTFLYGLATVGLLVGTIALAGIAATPIFIASVALLTVVTGISTYLSNNPKTTQKNKGKKANLAAIRTACGLGIPMVLIGSLATALGVTLAGLIPFMVIGAAVVGILSYVTHNRFNTREAKPTPKLHKHGHGSRSFTPYFVGAALFTIGLSVLPLLSLAAGLAVGAACVGGLLLGALKLTSPAWANKRPGLYKGLKWGIGIVAGAAIAASAAFFLPVSIGLSVGIASIIGVAGIVGGIWMGVKASNGPRKKVIEALSMINQLEDDEMGLSAAKKNEMVNAYQQRGLNVDDQVELSGDLDARKEEIEAAKNILLEHRDYVEHLAANQDDPVAIGVAVEHINDINTDAPVVAAPAANAAPVVANPAPAAGAPAPVVAAPAAGAPAPVVAAPADQKVVGGLNIDAKRYQQALNQHSGNETEQAAALHMFLPELQKLNQIRHAIRGVPGTSDEDASASALAAFNAEKGNH